MKAFRLTILILISTIFTFGQNNSWNGITPLHSTRTDVEKLLGKPKECKYGVCEYVIEKERVSFRYINKQCESGWDIPKDTVISIEITPFTIDKKSFDELKLDKSKFTYRVDDVFQGTWTNAEDGLSYEFGHVDKYLDYIRYFPKKSDNNLRCNGFPPFIPEGIYYSYNHFPFYNSSSSKRANMYSLAASFDSLRRDLLNLRKANYNFKAYVLIYFDKRLSLKQYRTELNRAKNFMFVRLKVPKEDLIFIEGGMKEEASIELYLLPAEYVPPAPNPTLPSPQFMRKSK